MLILVLELLQPQLRLAADFGAYLAWEAHDVYHSEEITHAVARFLIRFKFPQCILNAAFQPCLWLEGCC